MKLQADDGLAHGGAGACGAGGGSDGGIVGAAVLIELAKALNSAMPVSWMGNFCDASTLVCACSSIRCS